MIAEVEAQIERALAHMAVDAEDSDYGGSRPSSRMSSRSAPSSYSRGADPRSRPLRSFSTESTLAESFANGDDLVKTERVTSTVVEEDEPEDEDDAERRKKAGMGFELTSFNMREEMEEGKFTEDGMYLRTFDPFAVHDKWMDEFDDKDIKKARKNHKQQERVQKEKERAEERELQQLGGKEEMCKGLLPLLKKGETVLEALQRLGAEAKRKASAAKKA